MEATALKQKGLSNFKIFFGILVLLICGEVVSLSQVPAPVVQAAFPGWSTFTDSVYGYSVQYPASWYVYPADGSAGSVTVLSSTDINAVDNSTDGVRLEISLVIYDRDPQVSLRDWISPPSTWSGYIDVPADRPTVMTSNLVEESYKTVDGNVRRAYVARGSKTYILDLMPDSPSTDALFTAIVQSLTFTDFISRAQPVKQRLFGPIAVFLPLIERASASATASGQGPRLQGASATALSYRLPFVNYSNYYEITQGPGGSFSHFYQSDYEAIDFGITSPAPIIASETGDVLSASPDPCYGNTIKIKHSDGRVSFYAHLSKMEVSEGRVNKEAQIGVSGGTGKCTSGPHLHLMLQNAQQNATVPIRTLPGITWYSGDPNNPTNAFNVQTGQCQYGHKAGVDWCYVGRAFGPAIGEVAPQPICQISLNAPSDGTSSSSPTLTFTWGTSSCATGGYHFRVKTSSEMDGGGTTIRDSSTAGAQRTETIEPSWYNTDLYWSVKPANVANAAWAPSRRFRITSTPPSTCPAPTLNSPSDGATLASGTIAFGWNDVSCSHNGFTFRVKTVATMDSGGETVIDVGNGTTQRIETIGSNWFNRDLYWSVKAASASVAAWATARRFRITPVAALTRPTLSGPSNGASLPQSTDITLSWNVASGANQYKLELWGGSYSLMTLCDWQSGTSCHIGQMWPGTMSWHVRARNSSGQESEWGDTWTFTVQQTIATVGAPVLSSPSNGSSLASTTDVTLYWNTSSNATQYTVEVWGGPYSNMTVCGWQASTSCHIGQMWPGTMYWHVKARGSSGQESAWSSTFSFTIEQASSAVKPTLSSPSNGASLAQSTDVTLVWNISSGATQYKVELWGGPYSLMVPCNWQPGTSCHIGQMWPGAMYWHVKAMNSSGQESDWSDTWSFVIQQTPSAPAAPALSSPGNGSSLAQSTDVTLVWNTSSGATQYKVELWGGPYSLMVPCDWQSGTSCHIGQMWPGTMYWHVKARNASAQESPWSDTWSFTIQQAPQAPSKPTLASPGNGASMSQSSDVTLVWNTSSGASQYKVELWGGPYSLMTPCDWQSSTSCHIGQMWPGTMSWHVKARNTSGQESDWSDTWSFTIQQPAGPSKPTLSSPGNGSSMAQSTDVTLYWNSVANATQYKVELWGGPYSLMTPCDWQSGTSCHIGQMWPGTMSWHVKARNGSGTESDWSDTWSFTIQQAQQTWKPSLSSPSNGASLPRATDVTLVWNSLSGATQYKVELWGGPYSLMTPCNWQSGTSCHIGGMWPGNMSWHVKARDGSGTESDWSDTWNFTIQN